MQQEQMHTVLRDVGWWDTVKVSEASGAIVDGHARILLALRHRQRRVPVLYVRLSEAEERIVLAMHNQIAKGAIADVGLLDELIQQIRQDGLVDELPGLADLMDGLALQYDLLPPPPEPPPHPLVEIRPYLPGVDPEAPVQQVLRELPRETSESIERLAGHRTAEPRREPSQPMRLFEERSWLVHPVLDYGAGDDRHAYARFDPAYAPDYTVFKQLWMTITCNFVLNILPLEHNRIELLAALRGMLLPGGSVFVSVWEYPGEEARAYRGFQVQWSQERWERLFGLVFGVVNRLELEGVWAWQLKPGSR